MKRRFVQYAGGMKQLVDIPHPSKPSYGKLWSEHKETLQQFFDSKQSFFGWAGQRYNRFPTIDQIITDRQEQLGE